jgi:hypothetical protein
MTKHYLINILTWASTKTEGFSHAELIGEFQLSNWQRQQIDKFFENAVMNRDLSRSNNFAEFETMFYLIQGGSSYMDEKSKFVLTIDALFKYFDYQELQLATENAKSAWNMAFWALMVSLAAAVFQGISVALQWSSA